MLKVKQHTKPHTCYIHHFGGVQGNPRASTQDFDESRIENAHKARWNFESELGRYIGYNVIIWADGEYGQYRLLGEETAAQRWHNLQVSIALAGNFNGVDEPTEAQIKTLKKLMFWLNRELGIKKFKPHRAVSRTECYGNALDDYWATGLLHEMMREELNVLQASLQKWVMKLVSWFDSERFGGFSMRECEGHIKVVNQD